MANTTTSLLANIGKEPTKLTDKQTIIETKPPLQKKIDELQEKLDELKQQAKNEKQ